MSTTRQIRAWLVFFIVALVLSGVTAFPLETELRFLSTVVRADWSPLPQLLPGVVEWVDRVRDGLIATNDQYPFIAYAADWLAFAHLVIAVAFIGPLRDPVRNIWIIQFGMIACVGIIPLALIAGSVRGIPLGWQLIDMSFGVIGIIPLIIVYRLIRRLEYTDPYDFWDAEAENLLDIHLDIYSEVASVAEISALMGMEPDSSTERGSPRKNVMESAPEQAKIHRLTRWTIGSGLPNTAYEDDQLDALWARTSAALPRISSLTGGVRVQLCFFHQMDGRSFQGHGLGLSPQWMGLLAEVGGTVSMDQYISRNGPEPAKHPSVG